MRKKFLTNIAILIGVNLLIKPFWILGVDRAIQNAVGNTQYGIYVNISAFSILFLMLLDFGINNFSSSSIAKDHGIINKQFSSLVPLKIIFSVFYLAITMLAGILYGFNLGELYLLFFMALNQVIAYFILYFRSNVSGLQHFKTDALLSVVDRTLMIIFCSLIIWASFAAVTIQTYLYAQFLGYIVSSVICFIVLKPYLTSVKLNFDKKVLLRLVKEAYPYALLAFLIAFYTKLDTILIKRIYPDGNTENGVYASACRLLEASNMLAAMVASMLLSLFAKILSDKSQLQLMVKTSMSVMLAPAIMLSFFCNVYKSEIMHMLYKNSNEYSAEIFGIVILCFIPMCIMYIFGTLLTANGNLKVLNRMAFVTLIINFSLNIFLIPRYGALGAAVAAVITQFVFALSNLVYSHRIIRLSLDMFNMLQYIMFMIVFAIIVYYMHQAEIEMFTSLAISGISGISLIFIFRILSYKMLMQFASNSFKRD